MTYMVTWSPDRTREVTDVDGLEAVLDEITGQQHRLVVGVYQQRDGRWVGMDIGVGHPERSFVFFNARDGGYGVESDLPEWDGDIVFDFGGQGTDYHPEETRVSAATAVQAARQWVMTGQRPTCVSFDAAEAGAA